MKSIWVAVAGLAAAAVLATVVAQFVIPSAGDSARRESTVAVTDAPAETRVGAEPARPGPLAAPVAPERPPHAAGPVPPAAPTATDSADGAPRPPADPEVVAAQLRDDVRGELTSEFERARPAIASACFPDGAPQRITYTYHVVFDANGNEVARGVSEGRDAPLSVEQRRCIHDHAPALAKIHPPGQGLSVDVPMSWP